MGRASALLAIEVAFARWRAKDSRRGPGPDPAMSVGAPPDARAGAPACRSRPDPSGGSSRQRLRRGLPPVCAAHGPREILALLPRIVEEPEQLGNKWEGRGLTSNS